MISPEQLKAILDENLSLININDGVIVSGKVTEVGDDFVSVDVGMKSQSYVPVAEFRNEEGVVQAHVGDATEVFLESIDNGYGETCASRAKAIKEMAWNHLNDLYSNDEIVSGTIIDKVKGGFIVRVGDVKAFLPGSLMDTRSFTPGSDLVGESLELKVVKMDKARSNVVVSRKAVLQSDNQEQREEILNDLVVGKIVKGVVKTILDYGAFVDLGGIDGLLHITDISWKRIKTPWEVIKEGDELELAVLAVDKEKERVSLGLKQVTGDPWLNIEDRIPVGSRVFGEVTNITDYGCFVGLETGIEGLVHVSEMDWTTKNAHPSKFVTVGDQVEVKVLEIDSSRHRISLGLKQTRPNPWHEFEENHNVGDIINATVRSITDFGLFVQLDGDIDGLVHVSDISWTEAGEAAIKKYKKGDEVTARITLVDADKSRISLSIKAAAEDEVGDFLKENPRGTEVACTVSKAEDSGITVVFDSANNISGFIKKFDKDQTYQPGDKITAYVSSDERRNCLVQLSFSADVRRKTQVVDSSGPQTIDRSLGAMVKNTLNDKES